MRVAIDYQATAGQSTGFGRYVSQLLAALERMLPSTDSIARITTVKKNLRTPSRVLWDQVGLPLAAWRKKPDVLFVPAFSSPLLWRGKLVMTSHDLIGLLFPQYFSRSARFYWQQLLPRSLKHANRILAISEATKNDLIRLLGIPAERITVTPLAADPRFCPQADVAAETAAQRKYNLPRPFCLAVGTIEPRKNLPFLVEAFSVAKREDHDLVIVGKPGWDSDVLHQRIRQLHVDQRVRVLEYVDEADLLTLLRMATALLFPSRYEGFGLPLLEAMACGTPAISSTAASLPEVGGSAVLYADPADLDTWRDHISRIIGDASLRADLRTKGLARAATFSWARTARLTLDALHATV
ncbi:MAG: glycosyltransferase family 1 protein [Patescibacteria group bacterium]